MHSLFRCYITIFVFTSIPNAHRLKPIHSRMFLFCNIFHPMTFSNHHKRKKHTHTQSWLSLPPRVWSFVCLLAILNERAFVSDRFGCYRTGIMVPEWVAAWSRPRTLHWNMIGTIDWFSILSGVPHGTQSSSTNSGHIIKVVHWHTNSHKHTQTYWFHDVRDDDERYDPTMSDVDIVSCHCRCVLGMVFSDIVGRFPPERFVMNCL